MSRERYTYERTCPNCGKVAAIEATENDHPYMKNFAHRVEGLTDGFRVAETGDTSVLTKIECIECGVEAK